MADEPAPPKAKQQDKAVKPEKPDEAAYKAELASAEKELEKVKARLVRLPSPFAHLSAYI